MTRDERQDIGIDKWKANKGRGISLYPTGFGKTIYACKIASRLKKLNPACRILVLVPHKQLQQQWILKLSEFNLFSNSEVMVINTAVKRDHDKVYDLVIMDEIHTFVSPVNITIFEKLKYKYFLGLTATLNRLDGKERLLLRSFKIVDEISVNEAVLHGWIAPFNQYKVEINVDLTEYEDYNKSFMHHFAFFDYDLDLGIGCLSQEGMDQFHHATGQDRGMIMIQAMGLMRSMSGRKNFCYNHPSKLDIVHQIIKGRTDKKIMTFSKSVEFAEKIEFGEVYHGKLSTKVKNKILKTFNDAKVGVLNTAKALDVGADVAGVNVGIIAAGDSSSITKKQRNGRILRFQENKTAELWHLVIKNTVEEKWFNTANAGTQYQIIQDYQLEDFLDGKEIKQSEEPVEFLFKI